MNEQKKGYQKPELKDLGSVAQLTQTGKTTEGGDMKSGSKASSGR